MNCERFRPLVGAYFVDALDEPTRRDMHAHLEHCSECAAELEQVGKLTNLIAAAAHQPRRRVLSLRRITTVAASFLFVAILVFVSTGPVQAGRPRAELLIDAPTIFYPQTRASLRIVTLATSGLMSVTPRVGEKVAVFLNHVRVFEGRTDKRGTVNAQFTVPLMPDGDYPLVVKTGDQQQSTTVKLQRDIKILLVTDKPVYQPMQQVLIRALALNAGTLKPLGDQEALFEIEDPKGNKLFKKKTRASAYGIAAAEFQLADEVTFGFYKVRCTMGKFASEKTFEVKKYVLPKFKIEVQTDRKFYKPHETVKGSIEAKYFHGKPIVDGDVTIRAKTYDVELKQFAEVKAKTDANGKAEFEVKLPDYFVGQPLDRGDAHALFEATVLDKAEHTEKTDKKVNVANESIRIHAIAESGTIVPDTANTVYVVTTYPDGTPAKTTVTFNGASAETTDAGFASFAFQADRARIKADASGHYFEIPLSARDASGAQAAQTLRLTSERPGENLLLRTDKAIYKHGDTMHLQVVGRGTIFLDIVRKGETYLTAVMDGPEYFYDIPGDLFGAVELHAYKVQPNGDILRDSRLVYVHPSDEAIQITTDAEVYRPAQTALVQFQTVPNSAIGVIIVDTAVYALTEMQPGLEKVYFTLEQELMKPRVQIKYGQDLSDMIREQNLEQQKQAVAAMLMANVQVPFQKWTVNTMTQTYKEFGERAAKLIQRLGYYIVLNLKAGRHGEYLTPDRKLRPDLVEYCIRKRVFAGLEVTDPWGVVYTLPKLQQVDPLLSAETINVAHTPQYEFIFKAMVQHGLHHTFVEKVNGEWRYRGDVLRELNLPPQVLVDVWGDPITLDRLVQISPMFEPAHMAAIITETRKALLYARLVDRKPIDDIIDPATGKPFDVSELARQHPEFASEYLAAAADLEKIRAIHAAILKAVAERGIEAVLQGGKYRPDVLNLVDEATRTSVTGKPITMEGLLKTHPASFDPSVLAADVLQHKFLKVYAAVKQWCHENKHWSNGALPPDDVIDQLLLAKRLTHTDLLDVHGKRMQWLINRTGNIGRNGCGCEMTHFHLFTVGPDGKTIDSQYHYSSGIPAPQPLPAYLPKSESTGLRTKVDASMFKQLANEDGAVMWKLQTTKLTFDFPGTPLPEVVDSLREATGLNIFIDKSVEDPAGKKIRLKVADTSVDALLKDILPPHNLTYFVEGGMVIISSQDAYEARKIKLEIYDVQDLTYRMPDMPGKEFRLSDEDVRLGYGFVTNESADYYVPENPQGIQIFAFWGNDMDRSYADRELAAALTTASTAGIDKLTELQQALKECIEYGERSMIEYKVKGESRDALSDRPFRGRGIYDAIGVGGRAGGRHVKGFGGKRSAISEEKFMEIGRVREWFPETLYWNPQVVTDKNGRAVIEVPLADSITTWRVTAMMNSLDGKIGSKTAEIRVFQDFFVDIDFPVFLTQNDRVKVPISVNNYLKEPQKAKLVINREPWFELLDEDTKVLEVQPEQVTVQYFTIRVKDPGMHKLLVKAYGTKMSDAIRKEVEVVPDGKRFETVINEKLSGTTEHVIEIPGTAVDGSLKLFVKLYPSAVAQALDGLQGMLRLPYG